MDTHFTDHPELVADTGPFAGAAAASDAGDARSVPRSAAERPPRRRSRLLGGVAVVAVVAVGAGVLLTSPYSPVSPADRARAVASARQFASSLGIHIPAPLAPAAALAWFTHPNPVQPVRAKVKPLSRAEAVTRVEALHGDAASVPTASETGLAASPPTSALAPSPMFAAADLPFPPATGQGSAAGKGAAQPAPRSGPDVAPAPDPLSGAAIRVDPALPQPAPAGSFDAAAFAAAATAASAAQPATPAPAAAAAPARPAPAALAPQADVPAEVGASAAADPLAAAARMQGASLPTQQQTQVLDLVTKMATMVGDMRAANRDLVERLARADAQATERIDDLQRRVALAEANKAVNAAALAGTPSPPAAVPPVPTPATSDMTAHPGRPAAAAAPAIGSRRYRVQAASDRLAMLASVDAAGNDAAQLQASIGDEVPGCGHVKSILQRGTTWMVQAEHCTIQ